MVLILNESQARIRELSVGLREIADWLEAEVDTLPQAPADLCRWAGELRDAAAGCDEYLRKQELLPREPDPEREAATRLLDHAVAALTGEDTGKALDARGQEKINEVLACVDEAEAAIAAQHDDSDREARRLLTGVREVSERVCLGLAS